LDYVRHDEMRHVPKGEAGDVRAAVGRDDPGFTPHDERPQVARDEPCCVARPACQDVVAETVRGEAPDALPREVRQEVSAAVSDSSRAAVAARARACPGAGEGAVYGPAPGRP